MPIPITAVETFIKSKLSSNEKWAIAALLRIYDRQTEDEKVLERTTKDNDIGFTGIDAEILSSFAKQVIRNKAMPNFQYPSFLSAKQIAILCKKMPKYWRQVYSMCNKVQIEEMIMPVVQEPVIKLYVKKNLKQNKNAAAVLR